MNGDQVDVQFYDSMNLGHYYDKNIASTFLLLFEELSKHTQTTYLPRITYVECPAQNDKSSCGLYMLSNALSALLSRPLEDLANRLLDVRNSVLFKVCSEFIKE